MHIHRDAMPVGRLSRVRTHYCRNTYSRSGEQARRISNLLSRSHVIARYCMGLHKVAWVLLLFRVAVRKPDKSLPMCVDGGLLMIPRPDCRGSRAFCALHCVARSSTFRVGLPDLYDCAKGQLKMMRPLSDFHPTPSIFRFHRLPTAKIR